MLDSDLETGKEYQHTTLGRVILGTIRQKFSRYNVWNAHRISDQGFYYTVTAEYPEPLETQKAPVVALKTTLPPQCKLTPLSDFAHIWSTTQQIVRGQ